MKKIMIVEDEQIIAADMEKTLKEHGYQVTGIADSHETAVRLLMYGKPDLILCDVYIRGTKSGIDLIQKIRQTEDIPVIYITSYTNPSVIDKAIATRPRAYIVKPFTDKQLLISVRLALEKDEVEKSHYDMSIMTPREHQIFKLLEAGKRTREIADLLNLSFHTVEQHRKNILRKFECNSTIELVGKLA